MYQCLHVCLCTIVCLVPAEAKEDIRSHGSRVTGNYVPSGYKESNLSFSSREVSAISPAPHYSLESCLFFPPVHITYLQPRPLEYNSWLSCLPSPFYWHCCSGFLHFSSRRPRERGNMKFHALFCVVANSGFQKPICDHVIAPTFKILQFYTRYGEITSQIPQSGTECALNWFPIPSRYINYLLLHDKLS